MLIRKLLTASTLAALSFAGGNAVAADDGVPALLGAVDAAKVKPLDDKSLRGTRFYYNTNSNMDESYALNRARLFCKGKDACGLDGLPPVYVIGTDQAFYIVEYKYKTWYGHAYTRYAAF